MTFFEKLNFTSSNEDGRSELAALEGARRIVCLTGSGTRPLDMLLSGAEQVIAIDVNPLQNALLSLKAAAIDALDHDGYLAFVGVTPADDRLKTYARLRPALAPDVRNAWDGLARIIDSGVWYAGLWERVLRAGAKGAGLVRGIAIRRLFSAADTQQQARIWREEFDGKLWRFSIRLLGRRWIWAKVIGEPGGDFLPMPDRVEELLAGAFIRASESFLFRDSDFASLILRGRHEPTQALPLHMQAGSYAQVRERLHRLRIERCGLTELASRVQGADGFSLSDFGSYCDEAAYAACWSGVLAAAGDGARFCERAFMNPLALPSGRILVDPGLSTRLTSADRAIIYEIRAGTIDAP